MLIQIETTMIWDVRCCAAKVQNMRTEWEKRRRNERTNEKTKKHNNNDGIFSTHANSLNHNKFILKYSNFNYKMSIFALLLLFSAMNPAWNAFALYLLLHKNANIYTKCQLPYHKYINILHYTLEFFFNSSFLLHTISSISTIQF